MIDLHTHTIHSDGTDTVEELLKNAEDKKLDIISITDHDSVGAYKELEENSNLRKLYSGKIIPGAELKTHFDGVSIEVLAYGIDYNKLEINVPSNEEIQRTYLNKMKKVLDKYGFKYDKNELYIDSNNPEKHWASFTISTEILKHKENKELIEKVGVFNENSFYREHQSNKNSIFFVDETESFEDIHKVIKNIHNAGGLAFLAHGYLYPFEDKDKAIEQILATTDIDGIECEYPLFSSEQREKVKCLAKKYNKYMSGGTDYHAKNKPNISIGSGIDGNINIDESLVSDWINKCYKI